MSCVSSVCGGFPILEMWYPSNLICWIVIFTIFITIVVRNYIVQKVKNTIISLDSFYSWWRINCIFLYVLANHCKQNCINLIFWVIKKLILLVFFGFNFLLLKIMTPHWLLSLSDLHGLVGKCVGPRGLCRVKQAGRHRPRAPNRYIYLPSVRFVVTPHNYCRFWLNKKILASFFEKVLYQRCQT